MARGVALFLTVLTGFSGLVYQVAWQKYLASLLGSHSEATAAVLGIFLGGLSLGYALFGRLTRRIMRRGARPRLLHCWAATGCCSGSISTTATGSPCWRWRWPPQSRARSSCRERVLRPLWCSASSSRRSSSSRPGT
jgi:MFS family permease